MSIAGNLFKTVLSFFYPLLCLGCDKEIERDWLCFDCRQRLFTSALGVCPQCGRPVPYGGRCKECRMKLGLERIRALSLYVPPFTNLIDEFKYKGKTRLGAILGDALSQLLTDDPILKNADYLVPIPLHRAKIRERGYNQSEILAQRIGENTGREFYPCLCRRKNTKSQTCLSTEERFKNIADAFAFRKGFDVSGKNLILVDDVTTSGATLSAAAEVLKENGAKEVYGLVIAKG